MPQKVPHVLVAPVEDGVDAHKVGPTRVGRDERRQRRAVRVGSPRSDHDRLDLLLLLACVVSLHGRFLAVHYCWFGRSIDGGASPPCSGRASCCGGGERSPPIEVRLKRLFHASLDGVEFEVVPPRAEGDERFDLREGRDAADIDGEDPGQGGQVCGGGRWRIDPLRVYAIRGRS